MIEINSVKEIKTEKGILEINHLVEPDYDNYYYFFKSVPPKLNLKHYIIVFNLEVMSGIEQGLLIERQS